MNYCYHCMTPTFDGVKCTSCGRPALVRQKYANALPAGTVLCRGEENETVIGEALGEGGFEITYVGLRTGTRPWQKVCVKEYFVRKWYDRDRDGRTVIPKTEPTEKEKNMQARCLRSFLRESKVLQELRWHPGIVKALYTLEDNNTEYYTMEFLQGDSLEKIVPEGQKMDVLEAVKLLNPVMDALDYAHDRGILHRDVKPANIFLCRDDSGEQGEARLIDFGAAYVVQNTITFDGAVPVKSACYTPLEQAGISASLDNQGPWTDVYSMAGTLYTLITGDYHFPEANERVLEGAELRTPSSLGIRIPKKTEAVLMKGLEKDFENRYESVFEFQRALCDSLGIEPAWAPIPAHDEDLWDQDAEKFIKTWIPARHKKCNTVTVQKPEVLGGIPQPPPPPPSLLDKLLPRIKQMFRKR